MYICKNNVFKEHNNIGSDPILLMSPHSGREYDSFFLKQTSLQTYDLRVCEDSYVDILFEKSIKKGVAFLDAQFPRLLIDANRNPFEIDSSMYKTIPKISTDKRSIKVEAGIGLIPKVNLSGKNIYDEKISFDEVRRRLFNYDFPYHKKIRESIDKMKFNHKTILLLDCHSMPSFSCDVSIDIVLSNLFGQTADMVILKFMQKKLIEYGFRVSLNDPFKGGFIARRYGNPQKNQHVVQIEINRNLYLNEETLITKKESLKYLQNILSNLIKETLVFFKERYNN